MTLQRIACLLIASFSLGCAGGRTNLKFEQTTYPVSLSPTVLGSDGEILMPEEREVVGKVEIETKAWGLFWASVPLKPNNDVSDKMNEQVSAAGGQAVVNLRVTSRQCGLNHAWILSTVPLWPGCSKVFVQGDIIREKLQAGAAAGAVQGATP